MLEELLRYDDLGGEREIGFILFHCLISDKQRRISDVRAYSISNIFSSAKSFDAIISLLSFLEFVQINGGFVTLPNRSFDPSSFSSDLYFKQPHFYEHLFSKLCADSTGKSFLNRDNLRFDGARACFYVRSHLIEHRFLSLRNLLIRLGFFYPDETIPNHLFISQTFSSLIRHLFVDVFKKEDKARRLSINQLKARLLANEELGRKGELFVLEFEKSRLSKHPCVNDILRISDEYVNAGYDIESFENSDSIVLVSK
jgi:phage pi2 protein 07